MVPRMSYLVAQTREVVEYFRDAAPPVGVGGGLPGAGIWFEAAGVPLKWQLPFGVLWDLLGGDALLPWQITVRFQGFPVDEVRARVTKELVWAARWLILGANGSSCRARTRRASRRTLCTVSSR